MRFGNRTLRIFLFFVCSLFLFPSFSYALTVGPIKFNISIAPGESQEEKIILFNETREPVTTEVRLRDVTFGSDEWGVPVPVDVESDESLTNWISIDQSPVTLEPGEKKEIPLFVEVPFSASPGGYYAQILFGEVDVPEADVTATNVIASTVLLRVQGAVTENASVLYFGEQDGRRFLERLPIVFITRIQNLGTAHIFPKGNVRILDSQRRVVFERTFNESKMPQAILGNGAIRKFGTVWDSGFAFGAYTAILDLTYGDSLQTLHAEYSFKVIPVFLLFMWLVVSILAILFCIGLIRRSFLHL